MALKTNKTDHRLTSSGGCLATGSHNAHLEAVWIKDELETGQNLLLAQPNAKSTLGGLDFHKFRPWNSHGALLHRK